MAKLAAGDRVEVIEHSHKQHIGARGTVTHVGAGIKAANLPELEAEPRYSVALDDGGVLHDLREHQLLKLLGTTHQQER